MITMAATGLRKGMDGGRGYVPIKPVGATVSASEHAGCGTSGCGT